MKIKSILSLAFLFTIVHTSLLAQENTTDPVIVTATRLPTPLEHTSSSISVITSEDIQRKQYRTITEALQSVPSLSVVRSGGAGKLTSIFSRGTNANHTLVLIDGIEMNDPSNTDGRFDFAHLMLDGVERIEVLHGPQGTLYGSDAIGAVINIVTKKGTGKPVTSIMAEGGSFNTFLQAASINGGTQKTGYTLTLQHQDTDGISALAEPFRQSNGVKDKDGYENMTISSRVSLVPSDQLQINFSARHTNTKNDLDLNNTTAKDDSDSFGEDHRTYLGTDMTFHTAEGLSEHRFGISYSRIDRSTRDDADPVNSSDSSEESHLGGKLKFELQNNIYMFDKHDIIIGLESETEKVDSSTTSVSMWGTFNQTIKDKIRTRAIYIQDQFSINEQLFGSIGIRTDDHQNFGAETTYRVTGSYSIRDTGTQLQGAYATGFKAPTVYQLYGTSASAFSTFTGNPNLKPETSKGWEFGIRQSLLSKRLNIGATYFRNEITDLINFTSDFSSLENRAKIRMNGVETFARLEVNEKLSAGLNYSYLKTRDLSDNTELLRRPRRKASFNIQYIPRSNISLSAEGTFVGKRLDVDNLTFATVESRSYFTMNLAASYRINKQWQLTGRVENLLDKTYEEPNGFEQPGIGGYIGIKGTL